MATSESDSELSDPDSNITSSELNDEIIGSVGNDRGGPKMSSRRSTCKDNADKVVENGPEESEGSRYPKRKRVSICNDFSQSKLESAHTTIHERSSTSSTSTNKFKPNHQSLGRPGARGVLLGTWRDSSVPDDDKKHAVIGFLDVRGRLRTHIQPNTKHGEPLAENYPLPPGAGRISVAFERIILSAHLAGLDYFQVKEYAQLRLAAAPEESEDGRVAAEHDPVQKAIRRAKENPALENPRFSIDPLPRIRRTHILIGHWKSSSEVDPKDRHAVYGVLAKNEFFRVEVVRETKDGRFVDGNYPPGPGALWILWEEVELEPHLKALNRQEVKEYCRVRQRQRDHGETSAERIENETKAVYEAQIRAGTAPYKQPRHVTVPRFLTTPQGDDDERLNGRHGYSGHELCQSRRTEPRSIQPSLGKDERPASRLRNGEAVERTRALADRKIARAEATQDRVDRHAIHRERAEMAAAAGDANATAVAAAADYNMRLQHYHNTNGQIPFHKPEDMQQLNRVLLPQETLCMKSASDNVKGYDGHTYERKATGPFMGKLVSRGTIVTIDGDDYVEYRVLTKPSFF